MYTNGYVLVCMNSNGKFSHNVTFSKAEEDLLDLRNSLNEESRDVLNINHSYYFNNYVIFPLERISMENMVIDSDFRLK